MTSSTGQGFRLSAQQRRLWLGHEGEAGLAQCAVLVEGDLESEILRRAFEAVVQRHEALRTRFVQRPGLRFPYQTIATEAGLTWSDLPGDLAAPLADATVEDLLARHRLLPFRLDDGSLLRLSLLPLSGARRHLLLLSMPALCADDASLHVLMHDAERAYSAHLAGVVLEDEVVQYVDFAQWQDEILAEEDEERRRGIALWAGFDLARLESVSLLGERPGPSGTAANLPVALSRSVEAGIEQLARSRETTADRVILAAWQALLWRLGDRPDPPLGIVLDGRSLDDLDSAVGPFACMLPLASGAGDDLSFEDLVERVSRRLDLARQAQIYAFVEGETESEAPPAVYPAAFEACDLRWGKPAGDLRFSFLHRAVDFGEARLKLRCLRTDAGLKLELRFAAARFPPAQIQRWQERLVALLGAALDRPESQLGDLEVLGPSERQALLIGGGADAGIGERSGSIHRRFERIAAAHPERIAVCYEDRQVAYCELNSRANRLARRLRRFALGPEPRLAILLDRSEDWVVCLLAVLKAGGAYVPLDPALPRLRLTGMIEDSEACLVITAGDLGEGFPEHVRLLSLDREAESVGRESDSNLALAVDGDALAYVLFTSGSTGRPKAVAVGHRQVLAYLDGVADRLDLPEQGGYALVSTFAADLGNTMLFPALCRGGTLHVIAQERVADPAALARYFGDHAIDCLKIVPSHLEALLAASDGAAPLPRRKLVLGGEASSWDLIARLERLAPGLDLFNHYGPTETTVGVIAHRVGSVCPERKAPGPPLGRPLPAASVYLLDRHLRLVAAGAVGELHIGGATVARGYLGRPDATAEKFVPDPFADSPGGRLYRSGDLGRLREDGELEFLGRADQQLKIRGFRVEPGEIEAALARHSAVREARVVVRQDSGRDQLVAYLVPHPGHRPAEEDLRGFVLGRLPDYMVPAAFVTLDRLPLTPNGKLDRAALPAPDAGRGSATGGYVAPRSAAEEALAGIWRETLGVPSVGVHDNFFELGGDSILAIQVIAKANRLGFRLTPRQIFQFQSVADLAAVAGTGPVAEKEQAPKSDQVPLTPIQHWFFDREFFAPHHWNQSLMVELPRSHLPHCAGVVHRLVAHHDALRFRYRSTPAGWIQSTADRQDRFAGFSRIDLAVALPGEPKAAIEAVAASVQGSLSLREGPLARFVAIDLGPDRTGRLLIVAHHLLVDAVSWQILLEDLKTGLERAAAGLPAERATATTSFGRWAESLAAHARSGALAEEETYWAAVPAAAALPRDFIDGDDTYAAERHLMVSLEPEETEALVRRVPPVYRTQINDVLLTAVARGLKRWIGAGPIVVELEGHGREELVEGLDLSRTVGWFTTRFPVALEPGEGGSGESLKAIKEQLRRVPGRGLGYGLLRYLRGGPVGADAAGRPEVKFNYLGQLDRTLGSVGLGEAPESRGPDRHPAGRRPWPLALDGGIAGGRLHLRLAYGGGVFRDETIRALGGGLLDELRRLIAHCLTEEAGGCTVSDFPLARLDAAGLDRLVAELAAQPGQLGPRHQQLEDVYPLSPLQENLLVHAHGGGSAGFEQKSTELRSEIDLDAFLATWQAVVDRHPMLRTAFFSRGLAEPHQVVFRRVEIPFVFQDWRRLSAAEQRVRLADALREDRERGFDPITAPLMRIALFRLADEAFQFVWSYHHLVVDAWCRTLVLREVFALYGALVAGLSPSLPRPRPFRDYFEWLRRQDRVAAARHWLARLSGAAPNPWPWRGAATLGTAVESRGSEAVVVYLSAEETEKVRLFLRRFKLTLGTLWHGVWAHLFGRHCGTADVIVGTTVSGRPAEIEGVESIVGMLINNLPVRATWGTLESTASWLARLQEEMAALRELEWVSPLQILEWANLPLGERLFESLVIFQNYPADQAVDDESTSRLRVVSIDSRLETNFPLTVVASPSEPFGLAIYFDPARIDRATADRLARETARLALAAAEDPERPISLQPLAGSAERRQALVESRSAEPPEPFCPLAATLARRSASAPDSPAVRGAGARQSFGELQSRAARIADRLLTAGVRQGGLVAVAVEPTDLPACLWGVLGIGAAFVVVDPSWPAAVQRSLVARLRPTAALAPQGSVVGSEVEPSVTPLGVPIARDGAAKASPAKAVSPAADSLACVWLGPGAASGEGDFVEWSQETLRRQVAAAIDATGLAAGGFLLVSLSDGLESAALAGLGALAAGAALLLPGPDDDFVPPAPADSGRSVLYGSAAAWEGRLAREAWLPADVVAIVLHPPHAGGLIRELRQAGARPRILSGAGASLPWIAIDEAAAGERRLRPLSGFALHSMAPELQAVPSGAVGELFVGGAGLPRSFRDRPDLTALRLVPHPDPIRPGERLLATGRFGRLGEDGGLELLPRTPAAAPSGGALDLTAVECALLDVPDVRAGAVVRRRDALDRDATVAYVVPCRGDEISFAKLRGELAGRLARRLLPSTLVRLDRMPRTCDGDVDREALPAPEAAGVRVATAYVAPCDPLEHELRQIWERLFDLHPIAVDEDFFALGGQSLLAVRLLAEVRQRFGLDLPLSALVQATTIEKTAALIRGRLTLEPWSPRVLLKAGDGLAPIFCVHPIGGEAMCYHELARCLEAERPVYGLSSPIWGGTETAEPQTIEEMAELYLKAVREVQPEGPYALLGWSFGGLVAFEMARQIEAAGGRVRLLAPIDSLSRPADRPASTVDYLYDILGRPAALSLARMRELGEIDAVLGYVRGLIEVADLVPGLDFETIRRYWRAEVRHRRAAAAYRPEPAAVRVDLFLADEGHRRLSAEPDLGWGRLTRDRVEIHEVPGNHGHVVSSPYVETLACELIRILDRLESRAAPPAR